MAVDEAQRRGVGRRTLGWASLALGIVLLVAGAISASTRIPSGDREMATGTRVLWSDGDDVKCGTAPGSKRCTYVVEIHGSFFDPCAGQEQPVWREDACWPDGRPDALPPDRRQVVRAWGFELGDSAPVVYEPDDRTAPVYLARTRDRVLDGAIAGAGLVALVFGVRRLRGPSD